MAAIQHLPSIQRGDTVPYTFTFTDGVAPISMAGKSLIMMFKKASVLEDSEADLVKVVVLAPTDTAAIAGVVVYRLESSETRSLIAGVNYSYSIRIIEPGSPENIETTMMYGLISVEDA